MRPVFGPDLHLTEFGPEFTTPPILQLRQTLIRFSGSRQYQSCTIDRNDTIWLFGGAGPATDESPNDFVPLWSDLWTFDTKNLEAPWDVAHGFASSYNYNGNLVGDFVFNSLNAPGSRNYASKLVDRMDGTLLLYGGYGFYNGGASAKQDMWLFNTTSKEWALAYGGVEHDDLAITKTMFESEGNYAGSRFYHAVAGGTRNLKGDMIFYAGQTGGFSYYKDVWIVPQDQCALGLVDCSDNADCTDTIFGFNCSCKQGYEGDGVTCTEISAPFQRPTVGSTPQTGAPTSDSASPVRKTSTGSALKITWLVVMLLTTFNL